MIGYMRVDQSTLFDYFVVNSGEDGPLLGTRRWVEHGRLRALRSPNLFITPPSRRFGNDFFARLIAIIKLFILFVSKEHNMKGKYMVSFMII